MSGNEKLERELESFLAEENSRVAALYRKLPRHEPDAALDASVLAMARGAVAPRRSRNRWLPALSAAAVVLVVAGVAYRAGPQVWNDRGTQTAAPAAKAVDEAKTTGGSPAATPPMAQEPEAAMTPDLGVNTAKPVSAPTQPARADALSRRKTAETPRLQSPAPAPQAFPQPQAAPVEMEEKRADKAAATPASLPPPSSPRDAPLQSQDAANFSANASQKAEATTNEPAREQKDGAPGRAESASGALKASPAQRSAAPAAASSAFAPAPPATVMKLAPNSQLYPEHWISNIQKMLRENRRDEAIRNLDEFRKKYPDYRLPDDLRDLK